MRIDLLDMGTTKYGDCILVRHGSKTILIDGGHPGDAASIEAQLTELLGHDGPFGLDLLVVTHSASSFCSSGRTQKCTSATPSGSLSGVTARAEC